MLKIWKDMICNKQRGGRKVKPRNEKTGKKNALPENWVALSHMLTHSIIIVKLQSSYVYHTIV